MTAYSMNDFNANQVAMIECVGYRPAATAPPREGRPT